MRGPAVHGPVSFWGRFRHKPLGVAGLVVVAGIVIAAVLAPWISPYGPNDANLLHPLAGPSAQHLLGTDQLGRDIWSELVYGSRVSLTVGFAAAAMATIAGTAVGAVAGYAGASADTLLMRVTEVFQTLPRLVVAIVVVALFGSGISKLIIIIAVFAWPQTARVVRSGIRVVRRADYVEAARISGMPPHLILLQEILPNVLPAIVVVASLDVAEAILTEAALSFFGLGDPNRVSWGGMLNQAQQYLQQAWWMALFPGLAVAAVVLSFNIMGDGLTDTLEAARLGGVRR